VVGNLALAIFVDIGTDQFAERLVMLKWAFIFLVIAIIAGVLGFTDVQIVSATIARILFGIFLFGFLLIVLFGFVLGWGLSS
jgi:uncharacterized membrane protein YtjA (UPF0391 family)